MSDIFDPDYKPMHLTMDHRNLHTGNPELVESYINLMKKYYVQHRMYDRIKYLSDNHHQLSKSEVRDFLEKWDLDQGRAMQAAEKQLRRPKKPYQWSTQLRNSGIKLRYWKLRLRELNYHEDYGPTFHRWQRQIQSIDPTFTSPFLDVVLEVSEV